MSDLFIIPAPSGLLSAITGGLKRVSDGKWYRPGTGAFEAAPAGTDRTNYAIALTEDGSTGFYQTTMPPVAAGRYLRVGFRQVGASQVWGDEWTMDEASWTGSSWVTQSTLAAAVAAAVGVAAEDASKCRVYGNERSGLDDPVDGRVVYVEIAAPPQVTASAILEATRKSTYSNAAGYWFFDLVIGKSYRVLIPEAGVDETFTVPDQESYDFREELA